MNTTDKIVSLIGNAVSPVVAQSLEGRVLAVFERSFYVEWSDGALTCFGDPSIGAGPLNVLVADLDCRLAIGATVHVQPQGFDVAGTMIAFDPYTTVWQPRGVVKHADPDWTKIRVLAQIWGPGEGLAPLLPSLIEKQFEPLCEPLRVTAQRGLIALMNWLEDGAVEPLPEDTLGLIGLGPGLTPSGDDALAGAMIALRALGKSEAAQNLAEAVLPRAETATSRISLAHLRCAADGEGGAAFHAVLNALFGVPEQKLAEAMKDLGGNDHTSGWDGLVGVIAALR